LDQAVSDRQATRRAVRDISSPPRVYAALDLGTNNCRLLMATPQGDGFRVLDAFSRTTRLGEGLASSGALSDEAVERTIGALKTCALRMNRRGVTRFRAVATEACRRATNCPDFLTRVDAEAGLSMDIISADEEARLALAGCAPLLDRRIADALVFDIGGGSTELIHVAVSPRPGAEEILGLASIPLGVVTLAEERGATLNEPQGYADTVDAITERLRLFDSDGRLSRLIGEGRVQMLGTSGTVTTLAGVHLALPRYDRSAVDGLTMDFATVKRISRHLVRADAEQRAHHPCIGQDRADLVVAGCAILEAICRLWPVGRLRVADRGVREGVLLSMMRADKIEAAAE
jgi:exopolyphosphatase/guanosine-5'-triphosphate,3'-diphosphate pyrophosphatase